MKFCVDRWAQLNVNISHPMKMNIVTINKINFVIIDEINFDFIIVLHLKCSKVHDTEDSGSIKIAETIIKYWTEIPYLRDILFHARTHFPNFLHCFT